MAFFALRREIVWLANHMKAARRCSTRASLVAELPSAALRKLEGLDQELRAGADATGGAGGGAGGGAFAEIRQAQKAIRRASVAATAACVVASASSSVTDVGATANATHVADAAAPRAARRHGGA